MIIPVKCFTCGKVLANKWLAFKQRVDELESKTETKNEDEHLIENFDKNLKGKILDDLGLDRICCRRHMLSHIDIIDVI